MLVVIAMIDEYFNFNHCVYTTGKQTQLISGQPVKRVSHRDCSIHIERA